MKGTIGWYVAHHGKAYGPVAYEDLQHEVSLGRLKPRFDYVWRQGYKSWIRADELEGLFGEQVKATEQDELIEGMVEDYFERKQWGGLPRRWFLVSAVALPMFMAAGLLHFWDQIAHVQRMPILIASSSLAAIIILVSVFFRLKNLAMSYMCAAALFLPIFNLWLGYRLFACPAGYEENKDMDLFGWMLCWIYWLPLAALSGIGTFAALKGPDAVLRFLEPIIR